MSKKLLIETHTVKISPSQLTENVNKTYTARFIINRGNEIARIAELTNVIEQIVTKDIVNNNASFYHLLHCSCCRSYSNK